MPVKKTNLDAKLWQLLEIMKEMSAVLWNMTIRQDGIETELNASKEEIKISQ